MEMAFSRGLHTGWFRRHRTTRQLVHARFPKKRGVFLGDVPQVTGDRVQRPARRSAEARRRRGVRRGPARRARGGRARSTKSEVRSPKSAVRSGLHDRRPQVHRHRGQPRALAGATWISGGSTPGDRVWKTSDPGLERELRADLRRRAGPFPAAARRSRCRGAAGLPLTLDRARRNWATWWKCRSAMPLAAATSQPLRHGAVARPTRSAGRNPVQAGPAGPPAGRRASCCR